MSEEYRKIVISWCHRTHEPENGSPPVLEPFVEYIEDITDYENHKIDCMNAVLAGTERPRWEGVSVEVLKLRAIANSQRFYRIYAIELPADTTDEYIQDNIQHLAPLIQKRGYKIWS